MSYAKGRLFPDQTPKMLMENEALNGSIAKNPFQSQHFDLNKVGLYGDAVSIPNQLLASDFDNGLILLSYMQAMRTFN